MVDWIAEWERVQKDALVESLFPVTRQNEELRLKALLDKYGTSKNGHSHFAPSASAGWLNCAGFLLANAKAPDDAGIDAAYGTVAHHVAERWQKLGRKPVKLLGRVEEAEAGGNIYKITIDEAMMEFVEEYVNWCNEVPGEHFYEQKVKFGDLVPIPDQGGTADHFAIHEVEIAENQFVWWLTITDLKMGTGVRVYAENNTQAGLYALGVFREHDWMYGFAGVTIRICQPRLGVFETWTRTREEIMQFEAYVKLKSRLAWNESAPRTPSPKACQWCKVSQVCAASLQQADDLLDAVFEADPEDEIDAMDQDCNIAWAGDRTIHPKEVTSKLLLLPGMTAAAANPERFKNLSTTTLSYVLTFRRRIEKMFAAMADEALDRAEKGQRLPYQKLSDGRTQRAWADEKKALTFLTSGLGLEQDKVAPRVMISVAEAEKSIRAAKVVNGGKATKDAIKLLLEQNAGVRKTATKRSLTDLKDDRPDVNDLLDDTFEAEDDEDEL